MSRSLVFAVLAGAWPAIACNGGTADQLETDRQFCVDQANVYRTMAGKPSLMRSADLEAYAAAGAQEDGESRMPHEHFTQTLDAGVAAAELEIPQFSFRAWGGVVGVIAEGLQEQAQSPGASLTLDGDYTLLGCGVYQSGDEVTVVEDFR